jgi:hypothetical protein
MAISSQLTRLAEASNSASRQLLAAASQGEDLLYYGLSNGLAAELAALPAGSMVIASPYTITKEELLDQLYLLDTTAKLLRGAGAGSKTLLNADPLSGQALIDRCRKLGI